MKKFLFTLLTLFMASSAFAGDYFYIDDITLTKEEAAAGCKKIAYVKAHFENAVSAWQVDLTLPEGVTIDVAQPAADMTLTYLDKFTDEETMDEYYAENTYTPALANANGYTRFIVSVFTTVEYDEAGNSYGICYRPGDYDAMWRVRLVIPAGFKGGDLNVHTAPSGPAKPYPGLTTSDKVPSDHVTAIRIKADTPEIAVDGDQYKKTVTITAEEGATIYYSTDGESYTVYNEPVVFDKAGTYTVYAYAEGPGEEPEKKSKSDVATSEQFTIVEQVVETIEKPVITFSGEETTEMTVTVSCATEGVTLYVNGEAVEGNPYSYKATRTDVYTAGTVEVTAVAKKGELESEVASNSKAWVVQQKPEAPEATKTEVVSDTEVKVDFTPAVGTAVSVAVDGQTVQLPYVIERPAYGEQPKTVTFTVTVTGDNYTTNTYEVTVTVQPVTTPPTPVETKTFVKVTKADQLVVGKKYIIVCGNKAMGAAADGNFLAAVAITAGDEVEVGNDVAIMTLDGSLGHYTLAIDGKYLSAANSTGLSIGTSATEWAISDYNGTLAGYRVKHADYNRAVRYSSSYNRFGNYSTTDDNSEYAWIYVEKVELQDLAGEIVVSQPDENGVVTVTYTPGEGDPENYTVTVNGEPLAESYQLEDGVPMEFNVVVSAEGYNDLTAKETRTWTKPVPKEFAGTITVSEPDENGVVTVTYTPGEGDPENYTVTVNGEPLAESYQLEDGVPMEFNVVVSAEGYNDLTAKETRTWTKPTPKELTGTITFSVTQGNKNNEAAGIVTATYNGEETGVTVKIVGNPTQVAAATSEGVRLPDYGTYKVMAVATAEGYADLNGEGEVTWKEPQTPAPEFNVSEDGLTVEATGQGTVTLYIVNANGSETEIDNPTTFVQENEARTVNLKAVAHVDGAKDGVATKTIIIPAKSSEPGTGVNELVDGKAVKSVRYFNMAGQEMQEVNGVTIVVTTYTDGTTSAVKVMK